MKMNTYWQNVAMGVILLIAITVDTLQSENVVKRAKRVLGLPPDKEEEKDRVESKQNNP